MAGFMLVIASGFRGFRRMGTAYKQGKRSQAGYFVHGKGFTIIKLIQKGPARILNPKYIGGASYPAKSSVLHLTLNNSEKSKPHIPNSYHIVKFLIHTSYAIYLSIYLPL
jgi:hypothetical protein